MPSPTCLDKHHCSDDCLLRQGSFLGVAVSSANDFGLRAPPFVLTVTSPSGSSGAKFLHCTQLRPHAIFNTGLSPNSVGLLEEEKLEQLEDYLIWHCAPQPCPSLLR